MKVLIPALEKSLQRRHCECLYAFMEYFLIWSWFINNFIIINSVHMMVVQTSWLLLPVVDALGLQSNKNLY